MLILRAILQLVRLDSALLGFLAIFVPSLARTGDSQISFKRAIPLLFICICAFIANDLDDIDKDRVNHPDRPLPTGLIPASIAVGVYFTSLGLALFSTKYYVAESISFWYYGLIALSISYGYVVESFPSIKAPYVAIVASTPLLVVAVWHPEDPKLYTVAVSLFLLILGREVCMDIKDRRGDKESRINKLDPLPLAIIAFALQIGGLLLLLYQINNLEDILCLLAMVSILALSAFAWFRYRRHRLAIILMKSQLIVGLYFLV